MGIQTDRVANAIFLSLCRDYDDLELREIYHNALTFYEAHISSMAESQTEAKTPIRGDGDYEMRGVRDGFQPLLCAQIET